MAILISHMLNLFLEILKGLASLLYVLAGLKDILKESFFVLRLLYVYIWPGKVCPISVQLLQRIEREWGLHVLCWNDIISLSSYLLFCDLTLINNNDNHPSEHDGDDKSNIDNNTDENNHKNNALFLFTSVHMLLCLSFCWKQDNDFLFFLTSLIHLFSKYIFSI